MSRRSKQKARKSARQTSAPIQKEKHMGWIPWLETPKAALIFAGVFLIFLIVFYKPLAIDGLETTGADLVSGIGKTHQIMEYQKRTGERVLWNPYMFGGMPFYHRYQPVIWSVDKLLMWLGKLLDWRVWYFWAGGLALFLLVRFLGLSALGGFLAAFGFVLMPHFQALIVVGHSAKFRALMWMPWVVLTFLYFLRNRNVLSMFLFALALAMQMRTQHYQIIFYTLLALLFLGITPYIQMVIRKEWSAFLRWNALFIVSLGLVVLMVAQPLLPIKEYTPYSTRGGKAISLTEKVAEKSRKGVGFDYATNWSYTISEFWNFIIPKFHGGTSNEKYTGKAVPQLRNRVFPAYWGSLPFTQSYEYMSIILIFLAVIGIVFRWNDPRVKSFVLLTIFALLLSLGKHFSALYKLFFYYVPYFDKFRVPMMILTLVMFNITILGAWGMDVLTKSSISFPSPEAKRLGLILGGFSLLLLIPLLFGSSFSLSPPQELERYASYYGREQAQMLVEMFRRARLEILRASTWRSLAFFFLSAATLFSMWRGWLSKPIAMITLILLVAFDLGWISGKYLEGHFGDLKQMEQQVYRRTSLDRILMQDTTLFRVSPPVDQLTNDTRWCYYYQSIGGYSPAKLQVIQDVIDNNIYFAPDRNIPFQLKILSMLNVKYLISRQQYNHPQLKLLAKETHGQSSMFLYQNLGVLPRAFFVGKVEIVPDGKKRLNRMNMASFHPADVALLEKAIQTNIQMPDSHWVRFREFTPNRIRLEYFSDKNSLLVVSEIYYPKGWRAILDGKTEVEIYKTNHLLRSVYAPAGHHQLEFVFHPKSFYRGIQLSLAGFTLVYVGLLITLFFHFQEQVKNFLSTIGRK